MATTASMALFLVPSGILTAVTLAAQGEIKIHPIFSAGRPVRSIASFFASRAATSTGACSGRMCRIRSGKRTRISRTTAGQAELMTGRGSCPSLSILRVASLTSSAARDTSKISSKPMSISARRMISTSSRLLNCPYRLGAGRATVYSYCSITERGSTIGFLA